MSRLCRRTAFPGLFLALALTAVSAFGDGDPVVPSDLLKLRAAAGIDVSADGSRAVYVVTSMFEEADGTSGYRRHLWLADLTGEGPPRPLTHGARQDRDPSFAPDGRSIAFVRRDGEHNQIFVLPLTGGEAYAVTAAEHGARSPRWSPDGASILFVSSLPADQIEGVPPWTPERPGRAWRDTKEDAADEDDPDAGDAEDGGPKADRDGDTEQLRAWLATNEQGQDPRVLTRLDLQGERELAEDLTFDHLFVVPVHGPEAEMAEARPISKGFQDFGGASWMPDGRTVVAVSTENVEHPDRVRNTEMWRLPIDGDGKAASLAWRGWSVGSPVPSPSGDQIAILARDQNLLGFANRQLAILDASGTTPRRFSGNLDRDIVSGPVWSADGRSVFVVAMDRGSFPLLRIAADIGAVERVVDEEGLGVRDFDVGADTLVWAQTTVDEPWELFARDVDDGDARRLGDLNAAWVAGKALARPTAHWVERDDGSRVQYWVMKPQAAARAKVPTVLAIHGGPSSMWGPGEFTMWHEFQLLLSRGYGVVYANPRGSRGYGQDFRRANYQDWGHGPAGDILAALDAAVEASDWIDRDQLVVTGGSYAGYMTAWIVSQDHRFRAAVAQRGVYDLAFFFGEGNAWRLVPDHFGGYPWEAEPRRLLNAHSPQTFVHQIQTPLLILHSDRDRRTGVNQSEMLYKSLKVLGRPVEYVRYPEEGHDLSRSGNPGRRIDRLGRIVEFFERFVEHP